MDNLINGNGNPPPIPQRQRTAELPLWQNYNQNSTISMPQPFAFHQPFGGLYNNYNYQPSFNYPQNVPSSFPEYKLLRNAEESSKNTFQSIESVVNAFVSIVNMLNSTHNAVFNSFRALIGVVDQFSHLKHFIISTILIPLIRQIRYIWRSLLAILHLRPRNYANSELIWANINGKKGNSFNFVTFIFWIIAIGGPYFVYKWISNAFLDIAESANDWSQGRGEHYTAQALYNFNGLNADELSFSAFDILRIAPKCKQPKIKDWLLASNSDGSKIGLIPINYIKLLAKEEGIDEGKK